MLYVQAPQEGSYCLVQRLCCCGLCALNLAAGDMLNAGLHHYG